MSDFGIQIATNYGRVLSDPAFTPMILSGVIELTGYYRMLDPPNPASVNTNVPSSKKCAVFFRGTHESPSLATGMNFALYNLQVINGFWHVVFQSRPNPIRLYVFSNTVAPIPDWGVYFYRNGEIIYHQNCLPLAVKSFDRYGADNQIVLDGRKYGALPAVASTEFYNDDWGQPVSEMRQFFVYAGLLTQSGGNSYQWAVDVRGSEHFDVSYGFQPQFRPGAMRIVSYIETDIYDRYYKQSLGYE